MVGIRAGYTVRAWGGSLRRVYGRGARRKRCELLGRACQRAAQVVLRIGVRAWKTGAAEPQDSLDLLSGDPTAQQAFGDPQIGNAPVRRRETLRNLQAVQPTGINFPGADGCERAGQGSGRRRRTSGREARMSGFQQPSSLSGQARLCVQQNGPRSVTDGLTAYWFLIVNPASLPQGRPSARARSAP